MEKSSFINILNTAPFFLYQYYNSLYSVEDKGHDKFGHVKMFMKLKELLCSKRSKSDFPLFSISKCIIIMFFHAVSLPHYFNEL